MLRQNLPRGLIERKMRADGFKQKEIDNFLGEEDDD
jgi:hypothetical protein